MVKWRGLRTVAVVVDGIVVQTPRSPKRDRSAFDRITINELGHKNVDVVVAAERESDTMTIYRVVVGADDDGRSRGWSGCGTRGCNLAHCWTCPMKHKNQYWSIYSIGKVNIFHVSAKGEKERKQDSVRNENGILRRFILMLKPCEMKRITRGKINILSLLLMLNINIDWTNKQRHFKCASFVHWHGWQADGRANKQWLTGRTERLHWLYVHSIAVGAINLRKLTG